MWPFTRKMAKPAAVSTELRSEIMGRIHASNVASLADMQVTLRSGQDYERALERLRHKLGHEPMHALMAARRKALGEPAADDRVPAAKILQGIVGMLERDDLT